MPLAMPGLVSTSLRHPPRQGLRRWVLQLHLWTGLSLGLYLVLISVTGSALVARRELTRLFVPQTVESIAQSRLSDSVLGELASHLYPEYTLVSVGQQRRADSPVTVTLEREGTRIFQLFNPYTGADLGPVNPPSVRLLAWTAELHHNLLLGSTGRVVNGIAAGVALVLFLTGLVVWWPGTRRLMSGLLIRRARWPVVNRQVHAAMGFWTSALLLVWAVSGVYFAFPNPFHDTAGWLFPADDSGETVGELALRWLVNLHFGRFGGTGVRIVWIVIGLAPAALFATGVLIWWRRIRPGFPGRTTVGQLDADRLDRPTRS